MSKDKLSKEEIKGPDMFVSTSDRIFRVIEHHSRSIGMVLLMIAILSLAAVGYGYYADGKENKAAEALFKPEMELKDAESKRRESEAARMQALATGKEKKAPESAPADYEKDYAPIVAKITSEIKNHSETKAALVSALSLANFLIEQKQFAAALDTLSAAKYEPSENDLLAAFAHMHRGLVYLENQKPDEAISEYKRIIDAKGLTGFHAEALLKTGVAYETKGDANKARETYEKVTREYKGSEASATANQYLRLLDLKPQQG